MFQSFIRILKNIIQSKIVWIIVFTFVLTLHLMKGIFFKELANFLNSYFVIYFAFAFYIWIILVIGLVIAILKYIMEKIDLFIYSQYGESNENYYKWLGRDTVSEKFLLELFKEKASTKYDAIENITNIKKLINKKLEGKLVNYYLFKNHLEFKQKNNSYRKINLILFSVATAFFTFIISSVIKPKFVDYFEKDIKLNLDIEIIFTNENYANLIIFLGIAISIYFFTAALLSSINENKLRINYLISILDILIKEKENQI